MINKPFKPPMIRKLENAVPTISPHNGPPNAHSERPTKKRRISDEDEEIVYDSRSPTPEPALTSVAPVAPVAPLVKPSTYRVPLVTVRNPPSPEAPSKQIIAGKSSVGDGHPQTARYSVLWRKPTSKKHKTWDGDGTLSVRNGIATLRESDSGKEIGRVPLNKPLLSGSTLSLAGKEVEVDEVLKEKPNGLTEGKFVDKINPAQVLQRSHTIKPTIPQSQASLGGNSFQKAIDQQKEDRKKTLNVPAPRSLAAKTAFKNPLKDTTYSPQVQTGPTPVPRHDPKAPGALVMKRPRKVPDGKQLVDVVLDPLLGKHLREHQREGVKFLYECVMGLRDFDGEGAILADEMGLGKTLQTIALIWTLLKQNPIFDSPPVIKKALIVCPVTLINNWRKEFRKWLGNERIGVFVADGKKTRLTDFTMGRSYSVMIIGYERLRTVAEDLAKGSGIDIVIADEGHRLKTVQNKSAQAIQSLKTPRRVILSGTPIQNDLSEFFSMVNFVNDGLLGSYKQFVKQFENPIVRSRQPHAIQEHIEQGQECSEELAKVTSPFILRRTAEILSKYLPPKTEYVLFCDPLPAQALVYRNVLQSPLFQSIGTSENALQLITILKKICNSPFLLNPKNGSDGDEKAFSTILNDLVDILPPSLHKSLSNQASSKLRILDQLLDTIHKTSTEKVVLVSNYTSTLNVLAGLLSSSGFPFLRLDGSTPSSKRQSIVDDFNRSAQSSCFAFLLSAKAGGMGLNLIGASRLILFDVDWNPATDMQAMARIHREGQKRHCRIYRFVLKGSVEERIWQRQVTKMGLADSVMNMGAGGGGGKGKGGNAVAQFSREELKDLFRLEQSQGLRTHGLLACDCEGQGNTKHLAEDDIDFIDIDALDNNVSGATTPALEVNDSSSDSSDDDLPSPNQLTKASAIDMAEQERLIASGTHPHQSQNKSRKEKEKLLQNASLMLYQHIDVSKLPQRSTSNHGTEDRHEDEADDAIDEIVGDAVLMNVLKNEGNMISWVFRKTSENAKVVTKADGGMEDDGGKGALSNFFKK